MLYGSLEPLLKADFVSAVEYHPSYDELLQNKKIHLTDKEGKHVGKGMKVYGIGVQAAILASIERHPLLWDILSFYEQTSLEEILTNRLTAPTVIAYHCEKYGFVYKDVEQRLDSSIMLYPTRIIGNYDQKGKNSIAIHLCAGSWTKKTLKSRVAKRLNKYSIYKALIFSLKSVFRR